MTRVFVSYRRSDASSAARQLAEALKARFGADDVFLDTRDVAAGTEWRADMVARVRASDVVLVAIGPHWLAAAGDRARRSVVDHALEDVVRLEVETAFASGRVVIPVLVDEAAMPSRDALPRPFRPLADVQAHTLHHASWDRDLAALIDALERVDSPRVRAWRPPPDRADGYDAPAPRSDIGRIASYLGDGSVVTVLGAGANAADAGGGDGRPGTGTLPDTAELARHLARRFGVQCEPDDLARVAEHVALTEGRVDLNRTLRDLLFKSGGEPSCVHRFVATTPGRLRELGREAYQLVVTTSFDSALERAFDDVHEPYDLAVFVAAGEHRGRFIHVPWWDPDERGPRPIRVPNEYVDLPIDEDGTLARTVIVKLHGGAADLGPGAPQLRDNFVVTEDDYIGYLAPSPVESIVPVQILNKLRDSHFLFLGYRMRDWTLRVFLQRVWGDQQLQARSWAVDPSREVVDRQLWERFGVDVVDEQLGEFLDGLDRELARLAAAPAEL